MGSTLITDRDKLAKLGKNSPHGTLQKAQQIRSLSIGSENSDRVSQWWSASERNYRPIWNVSPKYLFECTKTLQRCKLIRRCSHLPWYIDFAIDHHCNFLKFQGHFHQTKLRPEYSWMPLDNFQHFPKISGENNFSQFLVFFKEIQVSVTFIYAR